jgi:CRP-like cAMP-binding protein
MGEAASNLSLGILSRSRVFQGIPSGDLERLAPRCTLERYRRGAVIVRLGEPTNSLIVVGRGRVKGSLPSPNGDAEFIVSLFWPGDVFGEVAVFDNQARAGCAIAVTECEILFVPRAELFAMMERRPTIAIRLAESLCDKLRTALDLSLSLRFLDVPARFYRRLLYLGRFDSRREGSGIRIHHGLSQRELADSIGASREALNKLFGEWKRAGLLEYGRGYVVVTDPAALSMRVPPAIRQGPMIEACEAGPAEAGAAPARRSGK